MTTSGKSIGFVLLSGLFMGAFFVSIFFTQPAEAFSNSIVIEVGKGQIIEGAAKAAGLFVADPDVADIQGSEANGYFVFGKKAGETNIIASDFAGGRLFEIKLVVVQNLHELRQTISRRFPKAKVTIKAGRGSVMLSGTVPDSRIHEDLLKSIKPIIPGSVLVDNLAESESGVIRLDVRILEVSRSGLAPYGINWAGLLNAEPVIKLLLHDGVATVVSETTLTTTDGKEAAFTAGEQIAVPTIANSSNGGDARYGIDFKQTGLSIKFTPSLLPGDRVSLDIKAAISNPGGASQSVGGDTYPNLNSRSYSTTVPLGPAESFILTGLSNFQTNSESDRARYNNIFGHVVRFLFGYNTTQSRNDDFLIVVTPYFGKSVLAIQNDPVGRPESILENILSNRRAGHKRVDLFGTPGFDY